MRRLSHEILASLSSETGKFERKPVHKTVMRLFSNYEKSLPNLVQFRRGNTAFELEGQDLLRESTNPTADGRPAAMPE
jgi:hypothetical protein